MALFFQIRTFPHEERVHKIQEAKETSKVKEIMETYKTQMSQSNRICQPPPQGYEHGSQMLPGKALPG